MAAPTPTSLKRSSDGTLGQFPKLQRVLSTTTGHSLATTLRDFVDLKLFPYLKDFKARASGHLFHAFDMQVPAKIREAFGSWQKAGVTTSFWKINNAGTLVSIYNFCSCNDGVSNPSMDSSSCTRFLMSSRIVLTSSMDNPFGSGRGQSSRRRPGT
jgi:hypothetical protein